MCPLVLFDVHVPPNFTTKYFREFHEFDETIFAKYTIFGLVRIGSAHANESFQKFSLPPIPPSLSHSPPSLSHSPPSLSSLPPSLPHSLSSLPPSLPPSSLPRGHFYQFGEINSIHIAPAQKCAFVNFMSRQSAEQAASGSFNKLVLKGG